MQGKPRTAAGHELAFIFFKIRETRCIKTRRSWQRRARLALVQRPDLSPSERHEICAVWSRMDCHRVNSPAMSKLQGKSHAPSVCQTITARSCTRRIFATKIIASKAHNTPSTDVKKPAFSGLAVNDDLFTCTVSRIDRIAALRYHQPRRRMYPHEVFSIAASLCQACILSDSESHPFRLYDSRSHLNHLVTP